MLDVAGGKKANKTNIQIYKSNKTDAQKFTITPVGKYYKVVGKASKKALDVKSGKAKNKQNVWIYKYNGTNAQLWTIKQNSDGSFTFVSAINKKYVLDLSGGKAANKRNVQIYKGNGSAAQSWVLTPAA